MNIDHNYEAQPGPGSDCQSKTLDEELRAMLDLERQWHEHLVVPPPDQIG